jgi:hypothetical protein
MPETDTNYQQVPTHLRDGLRNYIECHVEVGHFLTAVLSNDLCNAVGHGDPESIATLAQLVRWLYNEAPGPCWGSPEAVREWLAPRQQELVELPYA